MKKIIALLLCAVLLMGTISVWAGNVENLTFNDTSCSKLKIVYSYGTYMYTPPWALCNYDYTTTDANEIKQLMEAIDNIDFKEVSDPIQVCDGEYLSIWLDDKLYISFDVSAGYYCDIGDKYYTCDKAEYDKLTQLIYAFKTKYFAFDVKSCNEMKFSYRYGQDDTYIPTWVLCDYDYTTTSGVDIEQLMEDIYNVGYATDDNCCFSSDGEYLTVYLNGQESILFDVTTGYCQVGDKCYKFDQSGFDELTNTIYVIKTRNDIDLYLNNKQLKPQISPMNVNGRILVPVRTLSEALGANVIWNDETKSVEVIKDGKSLVLVMGSNCMFVNGHKKELDVESRIVNNKAMVPVREIAEFFDCIVQWKNESVYVYAPDNYPVYDDSWI